MCASQQELHRQARCALCSKINVPALTLAVQHCLRAHGHVGGSVFLTRGLAWLMKQGNLDRLLKCHRTALCSGDNLFTSRSERCLLFMQCCTSGATLTIQTCGFLSAGQDTGSCKALMLRRRWGRIARRHRNACSLARSRMTGLLDSVTAWDKHSCWGVAHPPQ